MKRVVQFSIAVFLLAGNTSNAQQQRNFKFDFGSKTASPGYIPVTANTIDLPMNSPAFILP